MQGEWQVVEAKGKKVTKDDAEVKAMRFVIKDNELVVRADGGGAERKKTFKLDPAKTPKEIDITSLDGQEKDTTAACIYKLEKDRLTICMPYFTKDPPSARRSSRPEPTTASCCSLWRGSRASDGGESRRGGLP